MSIRSLIVCVALALDLLCVAVPSGGSSTLASGARLWVKRYAGPLGDAGKAVAVSSDGTRVFVAGASDGGLTTQGDYLTIAYNTATQQQSWAKTYNGPGSGYDGANAVAVSPDGTKVFVIGESYGSSTTGKGYATVAYNASSGGVLWVKRYNGPVNGDDVGRAIAVSGDGTKVFVTGSSYGGSATGRDYATVAYNAATGAQLWAKRYNGPGNGVDSASTIAVSNDGTKAFVGGYSYGTINDSDYATVAYNAATGAQLWAKRYSGPGNGNDYANQIAVSPTGTKVLVTGQSDGGSATGDDYATIAYNTSTGSKLWASRYDGAGSKDDFGYALAVSGDGSRVFVIGLTYAGMATGQDYGTVAYNGSTGAKLWSSRYSGIAGAYQDDPFAVDVNPAGTKVFVTGESWGGNTTSYDGATVAYNAATGSRLWAARYNGPGSQYDAFFALAVGGDDRVYVTGMSYADTSTGDDAATVAYQG